MGSSRVRLTVACSISHLGIDKKITIDNKHCTCEAPIILEIAVSVLDTQETRD